MQIILLVLAKTVLQLKKKPEAVLQVLTVISAHLGVKNSWQYYLEYIDKDVCTVKKFINFLFPSLYLELS